MKTTGNTTPAKASKAVDAMRVKQVLTDELADLGLDDDRLNALAQKITQARPALADLVDEDYIADQIGWNVRSARTWRARQGEAFPSPIPHRKYWIRAQVDEYLEAKDFAGAQ